MVMFPDLPLNLYFGITEFTVSQLENRVSLKPVLGGMVGVAHFITDHEQTK